MAAAQQIHLTNHPNRKLRSLSSEYNCVGMVFAARRTWIEPEHVEWILQEDGYRQVAREADLDVGDVVVYRDGDSQVCHVGIIFSIAMNVGSADWQITVLSQWGADGEYLHDIYDVHPSLGEPSEFWTDRT